MTTTTPLGYDLKEPIEDRTFIGFEIDPHAAAIARQRLTQVQKPLPGLDSEQHLLGLEVLV